MDLLFSMTEMYDVILKALDRVVVLGRTFEKGEIIMSFPHISIGQIEGVPSTYTARGGEKNAALLTWDDLSEVRIAFNQGIVSMPQLSLITNSRYRKTPEPVDVSQQELLRPDLNGVITLSKIPSGTVFVYDDKGEKTEFDTIGDRSLEPVNESFTYLVNYTVQMTPLDSIQIGTGSGLGFVQLEGKTRVKGADDGQDRTALYIFPKVQLMSSLSIRLGNELAIPVVSTFNASAFPVGERGNKKFFDFISLQEDIDRK